MAAEAERGADRQNTHQIKLRVHWKFPSLPAIERCNAELPVGRMGPGVRIGCRNQSGTLNTKTHFYLLSLGIPKPGIFKLLAALAASTSAESFFT